MGHCRSCVVDPLTVCLVVLGRHVERLAFLDVIFGDAPPLTQIENFYQRMLAGDASEVVDQAERILKTNSLIDYYDEVALPALLMAQVDLRRSVLDEPRQRRIKETIDEVIEDPSDHVDQPPAAAPAPEPFALETSGGSFSPLSSAPTLAPNSGAIVAAPLPDLPLAGLTPSRENEKPVPASPAAVFSMKRLRHHSRRSLKSTAWGRRSGLLGH